MATDAIHSEHALSAAQLVQTIRSRPLDLIDPYPPASEMEVLVDMGARGKGDDSHPRIIRDGDQVVAYGAVDYSPAMQRAQLVGPVVHPAHRRKGHGRLLLDDLIGQARETKQKVLRAAVGAENGGALAFLKAAGFTEGERHTCMRMERPEKLPRIAVDGIRLERVAYEDSDEFQEYSSRLMPRQPKQTRALLKTDEYCVIQAFKGRKRVGCVEIDFRTQHTAVVESLEAPARMLKKGLGNALLAEAINVSFKRKGIEHFQFLIEGNDAERIEALKAAGFAPAHELLDFELAL